MWILNSKNMYIWNIHKLEMSPSLCTQECESGPVHLSRFSIHFIHINGRIPSHGHGGGTIPGSKWFHLLFSYSSWTIFVLVPIDQWQFNIVLVTAVLRNALPTSLREVPKRWELLSNFFKVNIPWPFIQIFQLIIQAGLEGQRREMEERKRRQEEEEVDLRELFWGRGEEG